MTRVIEILNQAEAVIRISGSPYARLEVEALLCHLLGVDKAKLYANLQERVPENTYSSLRRLIERRPKEPLAYLTNRKEFYGREFYVDRRVLVPRPETETLVEVALDVIDKNRQVLGPGVKIADVGTGSGAIAITLALAAPDALVYAIDLSPEALEVAAINCVKHGVSERIARLHGDLLQPMPEKVNIIVANLPYLTEDELAQAEMDWSTAPLVSEPGIALYGGTDGLEVIRRLLSMASYHLTPRGSLLLEIGSTQAEQVLSLAQRYFGDARHSIYQDLAGLDRILVVEVG